MWRFGLMYQNATYQIEWNGHRYSGDHKVIEAKIMRSVLCLGFVALTKSFGMI